jgi:hypothetical protein
LKTKFVTEGAQKLVKKLSRQVGEFEFEDAQKTLVSLREKLEKDS